MSTENYGFFRGIDHTIPLSSFILSEEIEMRKYSTWNKLRPMYSRGNILKQLKKPPSKSIAGAHSL